MYVPVYIQAEALRQASSFSSEKLFRCEIVLGIVFSRDARPRGNRSRCGGNRSMQLSLKQTPRKRPRKRPRENERERERTRRMRALTGVEFFFFLRTGLKFGLWHALDTYKHHKEAWRSLVRRAMEKDFSWVSELVAAS